MMNKLLTFLILSFLLTIACSIPASEQSSTVRQEEEESKTQQNTKGTTGTPNGSGQVCFPANARIRVAEGRSVRMDQLVLGPQGGDATGWGLYAEPANVIVAGDDDDVDEDDDDTSFYTPKVV